MMKKVITATSLTLSLAVIAPANAMDSAVKKDLTALTSIAVATAAAGPVGFVLGAFGGSWLADQVGAADQLSTTQTELASARNALEARRAELDEVEKQLAVVRQEQAQFAKMALDQLQLEMLFKTGDSNLTAAGEERLSLLATFLMKNPGLRVEIQGFADPRGAEAANLALSDARARQVAQQLQRVGVPRSRMSVTALGESRSRAAEGDLDAYALERMVRIELIQEESGHRVANAMVTGR